MRSLRTSQLLLLSLCMAKLHFLRAAHGKMENSDFDDVVVVVAAHFNCIESGPKIFCSLRDFHDPNRIRNRN